MKKYNPKILEKRWQKEWAQQKLYETLDHVEGKENYYCLFEFPYPSGNLHVGHWYAFAVPDIFVRYMRMKGYNVMYPIGFDAFGLPAENAAIKRNLQPAEWTDENIAHMSKQLKSMGTALDWTRELRTTDPEYYKWTQWLFLEFYKKGLVYRAETVVNWCPKDNTVLANEQVVQKRIKNDESGIMEDIQCCERCDTPVEQRKLAQWMMRVTNYADALLDDLEALDWPETTKLAQKNWIGRSEGAEIEFSITYLVSGIKEEQKVKIFTTRADTIFGATYVVLAPEHPILSNNELRITNREAVDRYIEQARHKTERERLIEAKEKTGIQLEGIMAINPANGEQIPVWTADYVLSNYGTGAVMAVPAHDERDFEFAKKYDLPIKIVVCPHYPAPTCPVLDEAFVGEGVLVDSGEFNKMSSSEAREKIVEDLKKKGLADFKRNYRLRDWIISRQRYWGVPIPMIHCETCARLPDGQAYVPVHHEDLLVLLPKLEDFHPSSDGRSPLAKATEWVNIKCPQCGADAQRETDTMDTFVDSSWYFIRYTDSNNKKAIASQEKMDTWLPVQTYIGGAEHNTMHLLYARFFTKAMFDLGIVNFQEPFLKRINHGIVLGPDGQKMSKSRGNVIDPDELVAHYGADTVRMYLAFMAPYDQGGPWDPKGINGIVRFLHRVWALPEKVSDGEISQELKYAFGYAAQRIEEDIRNFHFNTAVSEYMKLLNEIDKSDRLSQNYFEIFLQLLAPVAPHITEELWRGMGKEESIHVEKWPEVEYVAQSIVTIAVQINGKLRGTIEINKLDNEEKVKELALAHESIKKHLAGVKIKKTIFVAGKILNFIV